MRLTLYISAVSPPKLAITSSSLASTNAAQEIAHGYQNWNIQNMNHRLPTADA